MAVLFGIAHYAPPARAADAHAAAAGRPVAAVVVDEDLLRDPGLKAQLMRYQSNVLQKFGVDLLLYPASIELSPEAIRRELQRLRQEEGITGAFLVGRFKFARFKNASTDVCTLPEFYEDLDGVFTDTDGDGLYDYYDPWNGDEQEGSAGRIDIWVAVLKPYYNTAQDYRSPADVATYFQKVNADLEGHGPRYRKAAQIFVSHDWPNQTGLIDSLRGLYHDPTRLYGGFDKTSGKPIMTSVQQFQQAVAEPSELLFVFAHSGPSQHVFDMPAYPGNLILPGVLDYPGRVLLESMPVNPKIMLLWGCHTADIEDVNYMNNRFLEDSYLLTPSNQVLTLLANSKSIGLEDLPFFVRDLKGKALQDAWLKYLNHVYSRPFLKPWLGVRGVWEKERMKFVWGYVICGNPFNPVG